jgi:hypothetical protein
MITYNVNIPDAPNNPSNDQPLMKTNTNAIDTILGVNHVSFKLNNGGKHTFVQWVQQESDPATIANEIARYTKNVSGNAREHIRLPSNGTVIQVSGPAPTIASNGCTFLPGGLAIQWGSATFVGTATINFPQTFNAPPYSVQLTQFNNVDTTTRDFPQVVSTANGSFVAQMIRTNGGLETASTTIYWLAIGQLV